MVAMNENRTGREQIEQLSPLKKALIAIEGLQRQVNELERGKFEPIAVIGIGCRFPMARDHHEFWRNLLSGVDAVTETPADRWANEEFYSDRYEAGKIITRWGGFVEDVDKFDPQFFSISPREAMSMDPQQRLLLQTAWHALEDAGLNPARLQKSRTGVFVGMAGNDYTNVMRDFHDYSDIDAYAGSGNSLSIAANRLSYFFDFHGPSMVVDTACSSSLTALHLAIKSLKSRECDLALAGGVNLMLTPHASITFSQAHMLAPDGRCRTFDAGAEGYVRGEGCGLIVLKRLADAHKDGDTVLAVIRGSAVNQDGRTNGLTAPNSLAQQRVIEAALDEAQLQAEQIDYIEAHGTGTILGDPIEVEAIGRVMRSRAKEHPLYLGSVKTNIGHLEAAAGIAGVIKTVLALRHRTIPAHLHFRSINPHIPISELPITIPTVTTAWQTANPKRRAGVSAFGFGGTNVHMVLEEAEPAKREPSPEPPAWLFAFSAKDPSVLADLLRRHLDFLKHNDVSPHNMAFTLLNGRDHFFYRAALTAAGRDDLVEKLQAAVDDPAAVLTGTATAGGKVVFLFTGQGSQYLNMGKELYQAHPVFRQALDEMEMLSARHLPHSLLSVIWGNDPNLIDQTQFTQPALFAIEYALAKLWLSWGVQPDYVMGHSIGEIAAACIAGVMSAEDAFRLVAVRARLMGSLPAGGGMAAIFCERDKVTTALRDFADVTIAGVNGPQNTVISGPIDHIDELVRRFEANGVQSRKLAVSHAFHSEMMAPILDEFERAIQDIPFQPPAIPLVSNLTGKLLTNGAVQDARYWREHLRNAVLFLDGINTLAEQGARIFIEIGPNPHLTGMGRRSLPDLAAVWAFSLKDDKHDWTAVLEALAALYVNGVEIDWERFAQPFGYCKVQLPGYPFKRERYWIEPKRRQSASPFIGAGEKTHPLLGYQFDSPLHDIVYHNHLNGDLDDDLKGSLFFDHHIFPPSAFVEMGNAAGRRLFQDAPYAVEAVEFKDELVLDAAEGAELQFVVSPTGDGKAANFYAYSHKVGDEHRQWHLHAQGRLVSLHTTAPHTVELTPDALKEQYRAVPVDSIYERIRSTCGIEFSEDERIFSEIYLGENSALTRLKISDVMRKSIGGYVVHPLFIDACCQTICLTVAESGGVYVPQKLERQINIQNSYADVWCHAQVMGVEKDGIVGKVCLLNEKGDVHTVFEGVRLVRLDDEKRAKWVKPKVENVPKNEREVEDELSFDRLLALASEERTAAVEVYLQAQVARVLNLTPPQVSLNRSITQFGLDSIMAIELQNRVERALKVKIPVAQLIVGPTIVQLAENIISQIAAGKQEQAIQPIDAPDFGDFALSVGQKTMWVQHKMAPKSIFNPVYAVRVHARLDADALYQALQKIVNRHPALRTTFHYKNGEHFQRVHEYMDVFFQIISAEKWSEEQVQARIEALAAEDFDLAKGPLFKTYLFELSADEHILIVSAHHIITDMWSLAIVINEIGRLYLNPEKPLLPLRLRYTDFIQWQNGMLAGAEGEKMWHYWSNKLRGRLPVLELPLDKPRPAVQTFTGRNASLKLGAELTQQLQKVSDERGVTLYMTLLAAFYTLLYKNTGQDDLIVGTPTTGRSRAEIMDVVGYFVNPVALRTNIRKNEPFAALLEQVRQTVTEALSNQDYPLYQLIERLMPMRDTSRTPLFQVMFVYQRAHLMNDAGLSSIALGIEGEEMELAGMPLKTMPIQEQVSPFDLTLMIAEAKEGLAATITFNTDLFLEDTAQRFLEQYKRLLEQIAEAPETPLTALSAVPYAELYQVLFGWNDTQSPLPEKRCIQHLFAEQVRQRANEIAVDFMGERLTYAQLDERSNQLANCLRRRGVGPEVIVGLCVERSLETVVGLLGVIKAGGAYLPLDPTYPKERLHYMLENSAVPLVLTVSSLLEHLPPFSGEVFFLDKQWHEAAGDSNLCPECLTEPTNLAYVIYTSGSTGHPKGVMLTHEGLCNLVLAQIKIFQVRPESRVVQYASFSFDASVSEIFMALISGARLYMISREIMLSQSGLLRVLQENQITTITLPPSILAVLPEAELPHLKTIISAGEACTKNIVNRWQKNRRFINAYGPTESTVCSTANVVDEPADNDNIPIGSAIDNLQVYIVDGDLNPVPIGVAGELLVGGVGVARGYLNRPELTAERFIPNPWWDEPGGRLYRTGDLVRYLSNGKIEFLGRIDHQVKIRGLRVELGEIEAALADHDDIETAVVLARRDKTGETRLAAYYISVSGRDIPFEELATFMKKKLPNYMTPSTFLRMDQFPLTQNGKIDRKSFPDPFFQHLLQRTDVVKPKNEIERTIAEAWRNVLNISQVSINDNFFEIGGHSLAMVKLHAALEETLKTQFSVIELFQYPTIASQAQFLSRGKQEEAALKDAATRADRQRLHMAEQRQRMRNRRNLSE